MNKSEYIDFCNEWKGRSDFCQNFLWETIRHGSRNLDPCDDEYEEGHPPHPSYYGEEFYDMVSNYNLLIEMIDELTKKNISQNKKIKKLTEKHKRATKIIDELKNNTYQENCNLI